MTQTHQLPPHPHNTTLIQYTAPPNWQNPTPSGKYNLVILGAGSAGVTIAEYAAGMGAKVALIEKHRLGGDCLHSGCVPSKAIIQAAKTVGAIRKGAQLGVTVGDVQVDFKKVMAHVWEARAKIAPHDSAEKFKKLGVDVYFGSAEFTSPNTLTIQNQSLEFAKAVIATGSRPLELPLSSLKETGYLTNETLWNLTEQPKSMAIIGAGPIGTEMAQAFQRLGTQITLIDIATTILPREDADAAALIADSLREDGVQFKLGATVQNISRTDAGTKRVELTQAGETHAIEVEEILLAVGRAPNIEGLNLAAAGVETHTKGLVVNDQLQTTNPDIYGAGDVAIKHQFTHTAGHSGAIVIQNALFADPLKVVPKRKYSDLIIPWAIYTSPEIAHVGLTAPEAVAANIDIKTIRVPLSSNDRSIADASENGFVKIHVAKGSDKIVGATIVATTASEMINEITFAMQHKLGLNSITSVIHPYPTQSESIQRAALKHRFSASSPRRANIIKRIMTFARR